MVGSEGKAGRRFASQSASPTNSASSTSCRLFCRFISSCTCCYYMSRLGSCCSFRNPFGPLSRLSAAENSQPPTKRAGSWGRLGTPSTTQAVSRSWLGCRCGQSLTGRREPRAPRRQSRPSQPSCMHNSRGDRPPTHESTKQAHRVATRFVSTSVPHSPHTCAINRQCGMLAGEA